MRADFSLVPESERLDSFPGMAVERGVRRWFRSGSRPIPLHMSSFRQRLPRHGMPGEWRDSGHVDADDDDHPWPLDSGAPCRNDGNTSICMMRKGTVSGRILACPLPAEGAGRSTGRFFLEHLRSFQRSPHESGASTDIGTKVRSGRAGPCVSSDAALPVRTDETGRTGVRQTCG